MFGQQQQTSGLVSGYTFRLVHIANRLFTSTFTALVQQDDIFHKKQDW